MTGTRKEKLLCLIVWINYNEQYNWSQKTYGRNLAWFIGIINTLLECLLSNYSTIQNDFKEQQFHFLVVGQHMFMCKL